MGGRTVGGQFGGYRGKWEAPVILCDLYCEVGYVWSHEGCHLLEDLLLIGITTHSHMQGPSLQLTEKQKNVTKAQPIGGYKYTCYIVTIILTQIHIKICIQYCI